jgi:hypothetical protein
VIVGWFSKTTEERLDRRRSLEGVPVVNANVTVEAGEGDSMLLDIRLSRGKGLLARFQPPIMHKRVQLDELGSFVLGEIDGRKPVKDILDAFVAKYRTNRREAELSLVDFLKSLIQRQIISMVIK